MAGEDEKQDKTEDATPRRRQDAREEGQVALSTELLSAAALCAGMAALALAGGMLARSSGALIEGSIGALAVRGKDELSIPDTLSLFRGSTSSMLAPALFVIVPMWVCGMLVAYTQVGFQVTPKAIAWDLARLNPAKGLARLFSARSFVRAVLALAKILVITITMGAMAWRDLPNLARLSGSELGPMLAGLGRAALHCVAGALIAISLLAIFDYGFQRWQHETGLKMTKKELRDELRSTEGDPHIKARVRQVQREMARRRMMADVPKATVVVTNPTHYAVALRYDRRAVAANGSTARARRAPYVVAKGVDHVAQRIKEVAREAGVVCYEDVALARALHAKVEIGDEIPESFYQAVASVLSYVYRVQGEVVGA